MRIVLYRHLVEHRTFEIKTASLANNYSQSAIDVSLEYPFLIRKLRNSRFGPSVASWVKDYECLIWCRRAHRQLDALIADFRPNAIMFLADNSLGEIALRLARQHSLPTIGLFLDWIPIMKGYYGHAWSVSYLNGRFRRQYNQCDLAFCTSDGMIEELGPHHNSHVLYPIGGKHRIPPRRRSYNNKKFRLVYVGSVENFYGRMLCSLIRKSREFPNLEIRIVGPNADWPSDDLDYARREGIYLGFKPPEKAAQELADADACLVVMSFEQEYELFMRTSFTTKFLDYAAFGKPVILWGPDYCTPSRLATQQNAAVVIDKQNPEAVLMSIDSLRDDPEKINLYASASRRLHRTIFNPDRLQTIFVDEITKMIDER
ncbi:hypothetical protein KBY96_12250 [Cyanobium sp. ATX 6A2]|nr:hypothetical protein [Cyanobium sp. ATX 6A2]